MGKDLAKLGDILNSIKVKMITEDIGFDNLPKGWDEESVKKFAKSLTDKTASEEEFWRTCYSRMKDHFGEEGAKKFCSALKDEYLDRTDWRGDPGG